jgi:hypothetical protein
MGYRTIGDIVSPPPVQATSSPVDTAQDEVQKAISSLSPDKLFKKRGNRQRAYTRADEKAQELVWTVGGNHYLIETDTEFAILDQTGFDRLAAASGGQDILGQTVAIKPYQRPRADQGGQDDIKQALVGPRDIDVDDARYRDAVVDIHHNNGSIDDLPDDMFAAAMFDEELQFGGDELLLDDGSPLTFESIMNGTYKVSDGIQVPNCSVEV